MVEQDAGRRMDAEALAVVHRGPMRENLRGGVRRARIERRIFALHGFLRLAEHFRGRRLIKAGLGRGNAQSLKHIQRADARYLRGQHGLIPGGRDKGLSREIVHLVRLSVLHDANEAGKIDKVPVDERDLVRDVQPAHAVVGNAPMRGPADNPNHAIALFEQQGRQVSAVLPRNPSYHRCFGHCLEFSPAPKRRRPVFAGPLPLGKQFRSPGAP